MTWLSQLLESRVGEKLNATLFKIIIMHRCIFQDELFSLCSPVAESITTIIVEVQYTVVFGEILNWIILQSFSSIFLPALYSNFSEECDVLNIQSLSFSLYSYHLWQISMPQGWRRGCSSTLTPTLRSPSTPAGTASSRHCHTTARRNAQASSVTPSTPTGRERWVESCVSDSYRVTVLCNTGKDYFNVRTGFIQVGPIHVHLPNITMGYIYSREKMMNMCCKNLYLDVMIW